MEPPYPPEKVIIVHGAPEPQDLICEECDKRFRTISMLNRHEKFTHTDLFYRCDHPLCGGRIGYVYENDLDKHIKDVHRDGEASHKPKPKPKKARDRFKRCPDCHQFIGIGDREEGVHHCDLNSYTCPNCSGRITTVYTNQCSLMKHLKKEHFNLR